MKFRDFIKLYDAEVNRLVDVAGSAWAVYHIIKRCAFVDTKNRERSYWAYPSQLYISQVLEWSPVGEPELTSGERKKLKRATDALEDAGLIQRYRPLAEIERDRDRCIRAKKINEAMGFDSEWKRNSEVRDMLIDWGKMKNKNTRVIIYELVALREIETKQMLDKNVSGAETEMSSDRDKSVAGIETELSPQEEQLLLEEENKNLIIEEEKSFEWQFIQDESDKLYTRHEFLERFRTESDSWVFDTFPSYWDEQIIKWLDDEVKEEETGRRAKSVRWKLCIRVMGG